MRGGEHVNPGSGVCGRLATYRYYNMDQVFGQALATFRRIAGRHAFQGAAIAPAQTMSASLPRLATAAGAARPASGRHA